MYSHPLDIPALLDCLPVQNLAEELLEDVKVERTRILGRCPYHPDRNPSFSIPLTGRKKGHGKCFSCGQGASLLGLYMHVYSLDPSRDFREAYTELATEYAPHLLPDGSPEHTQTPRPKPDPKERKEPKPPPPFACIPAAFVERTTGRYTERQNQLYPWLAHRLGTAMADHVAALYQLGTANSPKAGTVIFWGIDTKGQTRYGQLVEFDSEGHRLAPENNAYRWLHSALAFQNKEKGQPLPDWFKAYHAYLSLGTVTTPFGAHLLHTLPDAEVCLVESAKTAMLCAGLWPERVWLATLSLGNLTPALCAPLAGRIVRLYPDLGPDEKEKGTPFELWSRKAQELRQALPDATIRVDTTLEELATAEPHLRPLKWDLADLFDDLTTAEIQGLFEDSTPPQTPEPAPTQTANPHAALLAQAEDVLGIDLDLLAVLPYTLESEPAPTTPALWPVDELAATIARLPLPLPEQMPCSSYGRVKNPAHYIQTHLATCRAQNGKPAYLPYWQRLTQVSALMEFLT
jgi:hypothetical protein